MNRNYYVITQDGDFILSEENGLMSVGFKKATYFNSLEEAVEIAKGISQAKVFLVEVKLVPQDF